MVTAIRQAILEYQNILNFAIPESADNSIDTQLRYGLGSLTQDGDQPPPNAYAHTPQDDGLTSEQDNWMSGDTFWNVNRFSVSDNPGGSIVGTYQYHTILHETGHALGLKHGHEASDGHAALPAAYDSMEFTVMTYRGYIGDDPNRGLVGSDPNGLQKGYEVRPGDYAQTLMMLDIRALQHLYGPDFTTQSGNTVYQRDKQGKYSINGAEQWTTVSTTIFLTIWDGGGVDTYDFSAFTTNQDIDLAPGKWSNLGSQTQLAQLGPQPLTNPQQNARGHVFNALQYNNDPRSFIEDVIAGSGNDTITGNIWNNQLAGRGGEDELFGLVGHDTLLGGAEADELYGAAGNDMLIGGGGADVIFGGADFDTAAYTSAAGETVTITPAGNPLHGRWTVTGAVQAAGDLLAGIEGFVFGDGADVITLGGPTASFAVTISIDGAGGGDIINGHRGREYLIGGLGTDSLRPREGRFDVAGGAPGTTPGTWIESLAQNDELVLDRRLFGADYTFFVDPFFPDEWTGSDGSTAHGIARIDYRGSGFVDFITGALRDDVLRGYGGDDELLGRDGLDRLEGGDGRDTLDGGDGGDTLRGGLGGDELLGGKGNDTLQGGLGIDNLLGGNGNDRIETGGGGDTFVVGQDGDDTLIGSNDVEFFNGGDDDDRIEASGGKDHLAGDAGNDTLLGGAGDDFFDSGLGIESIDGGLGFDTLNIDRSPAALGVTFILRGPVASVGSDGTRVVDVERLVYLGGTGNDEVTGYDGDDRLSGNNGLDLLQGGDGLDTMFGGFGADTLRGGNGNDFLNGGEGNDTLQGGLGSDNLLGGDGKDRIETGGGGDGSVAGLGGDDTLIGSADAEFFNGGDGDDRIEALGGNDHLAGEAGSDTLLGGAGNDTMFGGAGADRFIFATALNAATNLDRIGDFVVVGDTILLQNSIFAGLAAGVLAAGAFRAGTTAADANDRIVYDAATGALIFDANGNAAGRATQFAVLASVTGILANTDFLVI